MIPIIIQKSYASFYYFIYWGSIINKGEVFAQNDINSPLLYYQNIQT